MNEKLITEIQKARVKISQGWDKDTSLRHQEIFLNTLNKIDDLIEHLGLCHQGDLCHDYSE